MKTGPRTRSYEVGIKLSSDADLAQKKRELRNKVIDMAVNRLRKHRSFNNDFNNDFS